MTKNKKNIAPAAAKAAPAAPKASKAAPKAAKASKAAPAAKAAPKAAPAAAGNTFPIHINKTGRVCFSKTAAARIPADFPHCSVKADGKKIMLQPVNKIGADTTEIRFAGDRPYISATKILKATGLFDGSKSFDFNAAPLNGSGFTFVMA